MNILRKSWSHQLAVLKDFFFYEIIIAACVASGLWLDSGAGIHYMLFGVALSLVGVVYALSTRFRIFLTSITGLNKSGIFGRSISYDRLLFDWEPVLKEMIYRGLLKHELSTTIIPAYGGEGDRLAVISLGDNCRKLNLCLEYDYSGERWDEVVRFSNFAAESANNPAVGLLSQCIAVAPGDIKVVGDLSSTDFRIVCRSLYGRRVVQTFIVSIIFLLLLEFAIQVQNFGLWFWLPLICSAITVFIIIHTSSIKLCVSDGVMSVTRSPVPLMRSYCAPVADMTEVYSLVHKEKMRLMIRSGDNFPETALQLHNEEHIYFVEGVLKRLARIS